MIRSTPETRSAMDRAIADLQAKARSTVFSAVDARTNRFRSDPIYFNHALEIICAGLSFKSWDKIVSYLTARIEIEQERRGQGFGGETAVLNLTSARIVAREMADRERAYSVAAE